MNLKRHYLHCLALLAFVCSGLAFSAENPSRNGIIEALNQDDGSITISGRVLVYSEGRTEIYLGEQRLSADKLDTGMVVRYITSDDNVVLRMDLLGPADKLTLLNRH
jgi:hypothetical protein